MDRIDKEQQKRKMLILAREVARTTTDSAAIALLMGYAAYPAYYTGESDVYYMMSDILFGYKNKNRKIEECVEALYDIAFALENYPRRAEERIEQAIKTIASPCWAKEVL